MLCVLKNVPYLWSMHGFSKTLHVKYLQSKLCSLFWMALQIIHLRKMQLFPNVEPFSFPQQDLLNQMKKFSFSLKTVVKSILVIGIICGHKLQNVLIICLCSDWFVVKDLIMRRSLVKLSGLVNVQQVEQWNGQSVCIENCIYFA